MIGLTYVDHDDHNPNPRRTMKRTPEQIEADVKDELANMFDRLAGYWELETGDVNPLAQRRWDEEIAPQIVEFAGTWYEGNTDDHDLNMSAIAQLVAKQGFPCFVDQTGGGTATIYAGEPRHMTFDWERRDYVPAAEDDEEEAELRYPVSAGPGTFDWSVCKQHTADDREFSVVGDGVDSGDYTDCKGMTEQQIADEIIRYLRANEHASSR